MNDVLRAVIGYDSATGVYINACVTQVRSLACSAWCDEAAFTSIIAMNAGEYHVLGWSTLLPKPYLPISSSLMMWSSYLQPYKNTPGQATRHSTLSHRLFFTPFWFLFFTEWLSVPKTLFIQNCEHFVWLYLISCSLMVLKSLTVIRRGVGPH